MTSDGRVSPRSASATARPSAAAAAPGDYGISRGKACTSALWRASGNGAS
jgi:hypothetical protein